MSRECGDVFLLMKAHNRLCHIVFLFVALILWMITLYLNSTGKINMSDAW